MRQQTFEQALKDIRSLASERTEGVADPHAEIRRLQLLLAQINVKAIEVLPK